MCFVRNTRSRPQQRLAFGPPLHISVARVRKDKRAPGSLLQYLALTLRGASTTHTRHVNFSQTLVCEQLKLGQRFRFSMA